MILRGRWPGRRAMIADPAVALVSLTLGAVVLEVVLELHATSMQWPGTSLAVRVPVIVAVLLLRRRAPLPMLLIAVADVGLQQQISAALPIAAYAHTRYQPSWSVRAPALVVAAVVTDAAMTHTWGWHNGVVFSACFVLWPATLGAYVPARAALVAASIERAERAEAAQDLLARKAVFEERVRIAGEMHDVVGHRISLMVLHAGAVEVAASDEAKVRVLADQMQQAGRQALQELRQLVGLLREEDSDEPAPLSPQPTLADVTVLVDQSRQAGMDVTLRPAGEVRVLTEMVERTAYRIVQEALTNAGRHAPGSPVRITLYYRHACLAVLVVNGKATRHSTTVTGTGHGLVGLHERASAVGGTLNADPRLDGGFAVEAVLPG